MHDKWYKNSPANISVGRRWPTFKTFMLAWVPGLTLGLTGAMMLRISIMRMRLNLLRKRYESSLDWYRKIREDQSLVLRPGDFVDYQPFDAQSQPPEQ